MQQARHNRIGMAFLCFLLAIFQPVSLVHSGEILGGPFDLTWGASKEETARQGVVLSDEKNGDYGVSVPATNLTSVLSDLETIQLAFGYNDRLWRITGVSKTFENDPFGGRVTARYDQLVMALSRKYGKGRPSHYQDSEMWKKPDDFLMGIKMGRSWHFTNFQSGGVSIELSIRALDSNTSVFVLIYSNDQLEQDFKKQKEQREQGEL